MNLADGGKKLEDQLEKVKAELDALRPGPPSGGPFAGQSSVGAKGKTKEWERQYAGMIMDCHFMLYFAQSVRIIICVLNP